ncbi:LacI family DNA-binding transcriptional regulator [Parvularcula sp. ZS-1/3]|uniref:LacI family DNA-binding transcriptional regulator n=1 Tax=Parvularcula mediterranea TaxID=2732508 RepID=A0A7Y3RMD7_9PROT|nr:LacI family DNA-binding transcriptional regulator [Parvularcula mediterranea]NNU16241.1 LacI family DNA-binding transcriptional regulator [Parvularcula mediterranea]
MVRMVDVAKEAGVSIKTVSRVLNNEPHVQDAMRQKVRSAVERLGYIPSASARSLRSNRSYSIMLLIHDVRSMFVSTVQFGALQKCQKLGYHLQLSMIGSDQLKDEETLKAWFAENLRGGHPDGLVLVPPMANNPVMERVVKSLGLNTIRVGPNEIPHTARTASVMIDDRQAAHDMTAHLIGLGHRRIGFIRGKEDQDATHRRFDGYASALAGAGIAMDESIVLPGSFDFNSGLEQGDVLLAMKDRPTAVFASNDDMAAGVIMAAHQAGVSVPGELSVAGFDDNEIAERTLPTITTIRQPLEEIGMVAIEALVTAAGASLEELTSHVLPYELVERRSTAAPA